jgi:hypothetical protein
MRWFALAAALVISACAGSPYAFSLYSTPLAADLGYSTGDLDVISSTGNLGL